MKIILTGATGLVGSEVLDLALEDPVITEVIVLVRRPTGKSHSKLKEIVRRNFIDYSDLTSKLQNVHACIWCLGVSQNDVSKKEYVQITVDYAVNAAKAFFANNLDMKFCFLSGEGAKQNEKSLVLFGRIKGRAEKKLSELSSKVFHFRPGYIQPSVPRNKPKIWETFLDPFVPVINLVTDRFSVTSRQVAQCLLDVAKKGAPVKILDNQAIYNWQLTIKKREA